ncbi:MAG: endonuclease/exonuclease/phosphatase family protein, partial [Candidatus Thiodiazotropha sp.]
MSDSEQNNDISFANFLHRLNIAFWNISGLKCKLDGTSHDIDYTSFSEFIHNFEIIGFLETWADSLQQFSVSNYTCYDVLRQKHRKAFRNSGGIAVFVKHICYEIFKIDHLRSTSENLVWLKFDLKPEFINVKGSFSFICGFVYMSPEGSSTHSQENLFHVIENEMAGYKNVYPEHKFIVGGDFNAYTNTYADFIQFDSTSYIIDDDYYNEDLILPERANLDNRDTNTYGKALLDMCKSCGLRILNGRFGKDENIGNFTCLTGNSCSVIDYILAEISLFDRIVDFEVKERLESIHMPVCISLSLTYSLYPARQNQQVTQHYTTYSRYKFIEENKNEYIEIISEKLNASSD